MSQHQLDLLTALLLGAWLALALVDDVVERAVSSAP